MLINHETWDCRVVAMKPDEARIECCPKHPYRRLVYRVNTSWTAEGVCAECGEVFIRRHTTTIYCSSECREAVKRRYGTAHARLHRQQRPGH